MYNFIPKVKIIILSTLILFAISTTSTAVDFTYKIIEKNCFRTIKCEVKVRLSQKIPEEALRQLAVDLHAEESKKYDRMFILYFLPGMRVDDVAWATTHFDPNLEVNIMGMTIEEEKALTSKTKNLSGKIIGEWIDESPYAAARYTLLKRNAKIIMIRKYKDGSSSEKEMIQKKQSGKLRFEEKGGNDFGEYYLLESNGRLSIYDNAGLINTIRSIK